MKSTTRDNVARVLRDAEFRVTAQRRELLSVLLKESKPLTIREISRKLLSRRIDQVTVYRMVETFTRAGILREVNLRGGHPRYELQDDHDHHHIVCTSCDKVEDFVGCEAENLGKKALRQSRAFSKITGHSFDLYGVCDSCAK